MSEDAVKRSIKISVLKTQGYEHVQAGRILEAIKLFSDILSDAPEDAEVYLILGDLYHQTGDDKLAMLMYGQARRLAPLTSGISERLAQLGLPDYMAPAHVTGSVPNDLDVVGGLLQDITQRDAPISDEEIDRAAELLRMILTSPQPAQVVAEHLDEIDTLLPALIELNIRQAYADGQPELAHGLEELLRNIKLQVGQSAPVNGAAHLTRSSRAGVRSSPRLLFLNPNIREVNQRMVLAAEALADMGCVVQYAEDAQPDVSDLPDVILVNNPHTSASLMRKLAIYTAANVPVIYDLDQDFEEMPANHPDYVRFGLGNLDNARAYMASLMLARFVTVPNASLAGALSMARCPVRVVPDGWSQKNPLWKKSAVRRGTLNLGWVGVPGYMEDVVQARRVIARIMREFPITQLVIAGDAKVYQLFEGLPEQRKLFLPATSVEESPYTFAQIDVLFQPLRNIPFNRAISDRNLVEAGVRRIPWVASPMPAFVEWGEGGLLADTTEKWFDELRRLAGSEELRRELGEKGYQKARQREMRAVGGEWLRVIEDCLGGAPTLVSQAFSDD